MAEYSATQYLKIFDRLKSDRLNYDGLWKDLSKYCIPRKSYITREKTKGRKYDADVFDSTAIQSTLVLAAGLHSYLTNPATRWFTLAIEDSSLSQKQEVKVWLKSAEEEIYLALNHSNFSEEIHEAYIDLSVFGTAYLYEEEDLKERVRFFSRPIKECYMLEDERGRVDTVYRYFEITAKQAFEKWGEEAGEETKKLMETDQPEKMVEYLHVIAPRHVREVDKVDSANMPYESIYICPKTKKIVQESGFMEFPFMVPRFNKDSGDVYGSSPAMVSFSDIKMLNEMDYTIIRAAQKIVDPPLMLPHDGYLLPIKLSPAAINYKVRGTADDKIEPLMTKANIPVGLEMEEIRRNIIKKNFFVDLFLLLSDPTKKDMTATEVMQRVEEKMLILAPTLGRLMNELLDPIINRTFSILYRNGFIKKAPMDLEGKFYKIIYTSPLARAQRFEEMKTLNQVMVIVGNLSAYIPEVLDNIDGDRFIQLLADIYQVDPTLIRDKKVVDQIRAARQEALKLQAQLANAGLAADAAKKGAEAKKNLEGNNAKSGA